LPNEATAIREKVAKGFSGRLREFEEKKGGGRTSGFKGAREDRGRDRGEPHEPEFVWGRGLSFFIGTSAGKRGRREVGERGSVSFDGKDD